MRQKGWKAGEAPAGCKQPAACPLSQVQAGTSVRIKRLTLPPDVLRRLREIGFCEERKIRLLMRQNSVICEVCNTRFGLNRKLAEAILVEPLPVPVRDQAA
ncbi:MAG TPA: FeoA family protein [Candidatus Paceibacterota bacterium]|nr:ferrous iron transport protein A [Verrucomicrobiota bacterium]HOX04381.1 FeoA family protein [Verrucomicrobiota bacterium]HRZ47324.1 FeoA family protein [Candidatus Paceibacterota bacterium]HRZ94333.1 FeoA family protein [Candidatus Paceibacterota bacterium]